MTDIPSQPKTFVVEEGKALFRALYDKDMLDNAATMAFWLVASFLPVVALGLVAASELTKQQSKLWSNILGQVVPWQTQKIIFGELSQIGEWNQGAFVPIAATSALLLASSGIHAVFDGFDEQLGVKRSWLRKRGRALLAASLLWIVTLILFFLTSPFELLLNVIPEHTQTFLIPSVLAIKTTRLVLVFVFIYLIALFLYKVGIAKKEKIAMPLWPGCLIVAVLFFSLSRLHSIYVLYFSRGNMSQFGLAAVGVTMLNFYLFSLSLLVGLHVSQRHAERRRAHRAGNSRHSQS